jgi:hypothetical protein
LFVFPVVHGDTVALQLHSGIMTFQHCNCTT